MHFPTDVHSGLTVIRAHGRLNMVTAPRLERTIRSAIDSGMPRIVLDLSTVEFLDSTALGAIIAGMKTARREGGDLRLAAPGPQPSLVLSMTHLDRVLLSFDDAEDAEAAWAA